MKTQQQHINDLLSAEIEPSAWSNLRGGAQAIVSNNPHDLVTATDLSTPYDGNTDDVSELEAP